MVVDNRQIVWHKAFTGLAGRYNEFHRQGMPNKTLTWGPARPMWAFFFGPDGTNATQHVAAGRVIAPNWAMALTRQRRPRRKHSPQVVNRVRGDRNGGTTLYAVAPITRRWGAPCGSPGAGAALNVERVGGTTPRGCPIRLPVHWMALKEVTLECPANMENTMKVRLSFGNLSFELDVQSAKEVFDQVGELQEVFDQGACGQCGSDNIHLQKREYDGNAYYKMACGKCGATLDFGQRKVGGGIYAKRKDKDDRPIGKNGWYHWQDNKREVF